MKSIACITGTRPQLIKHAVLIKKLARSFNVQSIYTGQHFDYQLHDLLKDDLLPNVPFQNLTLEHRDPALRLGEMIQKIGTTLLQMRPDAIIVYGDTDSTLAAALTAVKLGIKLIHIEAGERSFNRAMPEEHNRLVTDNLSDVLFCASHTAIAHLRAEQNRGTIYYCGDLMKDLLLHTSQLFQNPILPEPYLFCTIHRNYTNQNSALLKKLLHVLNDLNIAVIFPVHPATQQAIENAKFGEHFSNIRFMPPVSYSDSIHYQKFASAVITDSGGIQKEAYWLKRRCITIRRETEWTDTLHGNWNQLLYDDFETLPERLHASLGTHKGELYGTGTASEKITEILTQIL